MTKLATPRGKIFDSILEAVGGTPLVKLNKLPQENGCVGTVLAKLEFFNPLSSVKDRAALGMIEGAEREGRLKPDSVLVEPTSGNTGIGLAFVAALKGYKLILTMPENMSVERRKLLAFLGATIVLTPSAEGMTGAIKKAEEIVGSTQGALMLQQFKNKANPAIHRLTTAQEIWVDTEGKVDVFIAGVGTGGTVQGIGEGLRAHNPAIKIIAIEPASSPVLSQGKSGTHGIQGIGANFVPDILDVSALDEILAITDQEAIETARLLAVREGIMGGISSGAAVAAALKVAKRPEMVGKTIVTLLPDSAERYLSTALFD